MFTNVYESAEQQREQQRAVSVISDLMDWHLAHPDEIPDSYREHDAPLVVQAADYISGMTDRFAVATHERLFRPTLDL
jgi:dGTPase